jgi:hypothetical protein
LKRKIIIIGIVVLILVSGAVAAFAASQYRTPAEAVAGLTGRGVQSVLDEGAETGKTYGTIAKEAGVLDAFRAEMIEIRKDVLAARVAAGKLTQEQADTIMARIASRLSTCDGSRTGCELHGIGCGSGTGFGMHSSWSQGTDDHNNCYDSNRHNRGQEGHGHSFGQGHKNGSHGHGKGFCSHGPHTNW